MNCNLILFTNTEQITMIFWRSHFVLINRLGFEKLIIIKTWRRNFSL